MHSGVGRLLLSSEIHDDGNDRPVRVGATRRTAFVIAGGHALTAWHCAVDGAPDDPLWLRLTAPDDDEFDLPVQVVDDDAAHDVAVLGFDQRRTAQGHTSGRSGGHLSSLGRREEALAATGEAVEIRRRLAGANPAAFEPDLARGLWAFAWVRAAGQMELPEAMRAAEESVGIYERLAGKLPQVFLGDLRGALTTLAEVLEALGRGDDATRVRERIEALG